MFGIYQVKPADIGRIMSRSISSGAVLKWCRRISPLLNVPYENGRSQVERRIRAIFVESSVSKANITAIIEGAAARDWEVRVGGELFSDAMGPGGTYEGTYVGMIDHNVTTIAAALGGEAPADGMQGKLSPE